MIKPRTTVKVSLLGLMLFLLSALELFPETLLQEWVEDHNVRMEFDGYLEQAHLFREGRKVVLDFWGRWPMALRIESGS
jgi:hypothetical protein